MPVVSYSKINKIVSDVGFCQPSAPLPTGDRISVRHPAEEDLCKIYELSRTQISATLASMEVVRAVYRHNRDTFWGVYLDTPDAQPLTGFYAFLHLNAAGLAALESGTFDGLDIDMSQLVGDGQRPAAMYVWAIVARRMARIATVLVAQGLGKERYGGVPIYCKPATLGGVNIMKAYGFVGIRPSDKSIGDLFRLDPEGVRPAKPAA